MTDILLISDTTDNINIAWRYFCTRDYNASATISYDAAMETLKNSKNSQVAVFYCGNNTNSFVSFYRMLRQDEKTGETPLIVLSDVKWTKVLSEYVQLKNACVLSMGVGAAKLSEVARNAARGGLKPKPGQSRGSSQGRPAGSRPRPGF